MLYDMLCVLHSATCVQMDIFIEGMRDGICDMKLKLRIIITSRMQKERVQNSFRKKRFIKLQLCYMVVYEEGLIST